MGAKIRQVEQTKKQIQEAAQLQKVKDLVSQGISDFTNSQLSSFTGAIDEVKGGLQALQTGGTEAINALASGDIAGLGNALGSISSVASIVLKSKEITIEYDSAGFPVGTTEAVTSTTDSLLNVMSDFSTLTDLADGGLQSVVTLGVTEGINVAKNAAKDKIGQYVSSDFIPSNATDSDINIINQFKTFSTEKFNVQEQVAELTGADGQTVLNSVQNLKNNVNNIQNSVQSFQNRVSDVLGGNKALGLVQRVSQKVDPNISTITDALEIDTSQSAFDPPFQIGSNVAEWQVSNKRTIIFSYINTVEELRADLAAILRPITGVVVHWTKHFSNQDIGSEEINNTEIDLGEDGIQYHFVIRRDGSLQRGRPTGLTSNHTTKLNHNTKSLGVAFVGGYNCPTQTENPDKYLSSKSLTQAQFATFEKFCAAFYLRYPGGQIIGHNDLDPEFIDPGFDVRDYVEDVFNKKSLFADPSVGTAFEPAEINSTVLP